MSESTPAMGAGPVDEVARDADGVAQAMEADGARFAVGVQWHPETADDSGVFDGLVAAAGERAARRP